MNRVVLTVLVSAVLECTAFAGYAPRVEPSQISFNAETDNGTRRYEYVWRDSLEVTHETKFEFPEADVKRGCEDIKPPVFILSDEDFSELSEIASGIAADRGFSSKLEMYGGRRDVLASLQGEGVTPEEEEDFRRVFHEASAEMNADKMKSEFYALTDKDGNYIYLDYSALVDRYARFGRVMAAELSKTAPTDAREKARHVLEFIQTIPYSSETPNGTSFQTPAAVMETNSGDCDTKSLFFSVILESMGIKTILVLVPEHMFAAVDVPKAPGDRTFLCNGQVFVGCEPVGGENLGKISQNSEIGLAKGEGITTFAGTEFLPDRVWIRSP